MNEESTITNNTSAWGIVVCMLFVWVVSMVTMGNAVRTVGDRLTAMRVQCLSAPK